MNFELLFDFGSTQTLNPLIILNHTRKLSFVVRMILTRRRWLRALEKVLGDTYLTTSLSRPRPCAAVRTRPTTRPRSFSAPKPLWRASSPLRCLHHSFAGERAHRLPHAAPDTANRLPPERASELTFAFPGLLLNSLL